MISRSGRSLLLLGAAAQIAMLAPVASPAQAQRWDDRRGDRWDHDRGRGDWNRRDWERKRRKDAKTDGVVAGVVGTAVLAGVIAAVASSSKNKNRDRDGDRAQYCRDRYGNYDAGSDGYRASDGRIYRCE
jgi:hypothetical protein